MGNNLINCCDASSKVHEFSLASPKAIHSMSFSYESAQMRSPPPFIFSEKKKLLILRVLASDKLAKGSLLTISPGGLTGSLRGVEDGYTFFGSKKKMNGKIVNDFLIPSSSLSEEEARGRHFVVYFNTDKQSFYVKDLDKGMGIFLKMDSAIELKDNMLINLGDSFLVVNIDNSTLEVKIFSGLQNENTVWSFNGEDFIGRLLTLGRAKYADIYIDDSLISKVQCTLQFTGHWMLFDGGKDRPSTNGSWLYLNDDSELLDGMVFKANQTVFDVSLG